MIAAAEAYGRYFGTLTPAALDQLERFVVPDVHFTDPFSDVVGSAAMRRILVRMFADLPDARFAVTDIAVGEAAYLRWRFTGGRWSFDGVSELHFADDGRVRRHLDHWDAAGQLYERLPLLGTVLRAIRRRIAAPATA